MPHRLEVTLQPELFDPHGQGVVRKAGDGVTETVVESDCTFVPLLGRFAWPEEQGTGE